jgi:uncharacterized repeat protein (TIGR03843 family)
MGPGPSFDPGRVERALLQLPCVELEGLFRGSSNYTFLVRLREDGGEGPDGMLAVYKPAQGESPLWDFPAGTLYRREVAAYLLARFLGWPRVPPTVVRHDAPHGVGALQMYLEADPSRHYLSSAERPRETWLPVALFDVVTVTWVPGGPWSTLRAIDGVGAAAAATKSGRASRVSTGTARRRPLIWAAMVPTRRSLDVGAGSRG